MPPSYSNALGDVFKGVQPALAYAAAHLDDDISLSALAARARTSPFHFHRTFSAVAGETAKQFTLRLRLDRAAALLLTTDRTVLDIALSCGFQSHETFCRAFRRRLKTTPREYRKRGLLDAGSAQTQKHAELVNAIGPCVRLFHIRQHPASKENTVPYSVEKKELSPQPVLLVRKRVKRSEIAATIGEALGHIFLYAQQNGIALAGHPLTRYTDIGPGLVTMEPAMRIVASPQGTPVPDAAQTTVIVDTLPGGPAAFTTHMGPYDRLPDAYAAIQQWMETEGLAAAGAPWESYVTDPGEHPDPKDWKTEIFWPLAR